MTVISVPGDKSISHRALMLSALADGVTYISGGLTSDDCVCTVQAFRQLGVRIDILPEDTWVVHGVGLYGLQKPTQSIDCGNSGTLMRLLAGVLVAQPFDSVLIGDESLSSRPMMRIVEPLRLMGANIQATDGHAPIYITGRQTLHAILYTLPVASAQVKSCLMLAGLYTKDEVVVHASENTRDHTERMLKWFQASKAPRKINIPGDISSAAFFIVLACLKRAKPLTIQSVGINPTRTGILDVLKAMGADICLCDEQMYGYEPVADIMVKPSQLCGVQVDAETLVRAIDEFPVLCIAAACAKGKTRIEGIEELKYKESNRVEAMRKGLQALGITVNLEQDAIEITGGQFKPGFVESYGDHRIAMAFLIARSIANIEIEVINTDCISTSFPGFLDILRGL